MVAALRTDLGIRQAEKETRANLESRLSWRPFSFKRNVASWPDDDFLRLTQH
jgi:hypothetical protein